MKAPGESVRARSLAKGPNEALALLHFAFRAVVAEPDAELERRGLGRVHHRILFFIARTPALRIVDLLSTLGVTKQALHSPLQQLIRQKLVQSRAEPSNRRERRLTLTSAGKALERRLSGQQRRAFAAAFRQVGAKKADGWRAVMRELIRAAPANRR
jgi:DNA-binding MarR family transcriptional regulator